MSEKFVLGEEEENTTSITLEDKESEEKSKKPWYEWEVGEDTYKLKLTTSAICALEDKFRGQNLLEVISANGMPPLKTMLVIIQASLIKYHNNIKYSKVQDIYDDYVDAGGTLTSLYADVIIGLMTVSGFFTESQALKLTKTIKEAELDM